MEEGTRTSDLVYAAVFAGAVGSGAIALLFVAIDALRGNPLFTPSLMGSVLLTDATPGESVPVRLDMVAIYSLIHLLAMTLMGVLFSLLRFRTSLFDARPWLMGSLIFGILTLAIWTADQTIMGGVVAVLGPTNVVLGNAVAAVAMTDFVGRTASDTA